MSDNVIPFPPRQLPFIATNASSMVPPIKNSAASSSGFTVPATREITPAIYPTVPADIRQVCSDHLGCQDILRVPVLPDPDAHPKNYVENIAWEMLSKGGRPVFGYRIRNSAVFVVAEFYAMHRTENGYVDTTPNAHGDGYVVFAPDLNIPPDYDFLDSPPTKRIRTYEPPTWQARVASSIAAMEPDRRASERLRAAKKRLTLEDVMSFKLGPDKLEVSIDRFITCAEELELYEMAVIAGREVVDSEQLAFLRRRKATLGALVEDEYTRHRADSNGPFSRDDGIRRGSSDASTTS